MTQAKAGDRVRISFTGRLADGEIFDTTQECHDDDCGCETGPLEFVIGDEEIISGLNEAVIGMSPGQQKTVRVEADRAFGQRDEELLMVVERSELPDDLDPQIGDTLALTDEDGEDFPVIVTALGEATVTLDANHPLAGEDISLEIEMLEIL